MEWKCLSLPPALRVEPISDRLGSFMIDWKENKREFATHTHA
jgi:hypothetical protein